jgi:protein gp37
MGATTNIEWTDATINFWIGCNKVSAGCKYCYMFRILEKDGKDATAIFKVSDYTIYNTLNNLNDKKEDFH